MMQLNPSKTKVIWFKPLKITWNDLLPPVGSDAIMPMDAVAVHNLGVLNITTWQACSNNSHSNNYTGFQCNTASRTNCVYWCTLFTAHRYLLVSLTLLPKRQVSAHNGDFGPAAVFNMNNHAGACTQIKFGQRAFSYSVPAPWNSLPPSLQQLSDTASFKWNVKTLLLQRAFSDWFLFILYLLYSI